MKACLISLLSILFLSFSGRDPHDHFSPPEQFADRVRYVTTEFYYRQNPSDTLTWSYTDRVNYDSTGREISDSRYTHDGSLICTDTIRYDSRGKRLEKIDHNTDGSVFQRYEFIYDFYGRKVEQNLHKGNGSLSGITTYLYDSLGRCTEWDFRTETGLLYRVTTLSYDSLSNLIEQQEHTLTSQKEISKDIYSKFIYSYNEAGQKTESRSYRHMHSDSLLSRYTYAYDQRGNLIKCSTYDGKGKLIKDNTAAAPIYRYQYDQTGNWVKKEAKSYNNKVQMRWIRRIEYY